MKPSDLYKDIITFCKENQDEAIVKKYSRYFKEGYEGYGVSDEIFRSKVKSIISDYPVNLKLVIDTSILLVKNPKYEAASFAFHLLLTYKKQFDISTFELISKWYDIGINNWAHNDFICGEIFSYMFDKAIIKIENFADWRISERKYKRRAVPVALIKPMKKSKDVVPMIKFIEPLMLDTERVLHQGVGWFLREAWKINKEETEKFLFKYKNVAPRLIFQYATEKMSKDEKERFRREK